MSVRPNNAKAQTEEIAGVFQGNTTALAEGSTSYNGSAVGSAPLKRTITANLSVSLGELAQSPETSARWQPSRQALEAVFRQAQFTDLSGSQTMNGDLSSAVVHSITCTKVSSSFPLAVGAKITGVDSQAFSMRGDAYSTIIHPNETSTNPVTLKEDDVSVATDFMTQYPGYTAANLRTKGVHPVTNKGFHLVASNHPVMTAIEDNKEMLGAGDVSMMDGDLYKISTQLYNTVMPIVQQQVGTQVRTVPLNNMSVEIEPADFSSWRSATDAHIAQACKGVRERRNIALRGVDDAAKRTEITERFAQEEMDTATHEQTKVQNCCLTLEYQYNFMSPDA